MGALSGLKILDFSTLLPGPYATMMMADMGAEVLRVESPTRPDLVRDIPPKVDGISSKHATLNRNKRAISLDLKNPNAIALIESLIHEYDIVIEQFRPGVMDRLGLGYDRLKVINPTVIYCSITGYGQTGPYKDRAGHDINYLSIAGINSYSGRKGERTPLMGAQIADVAGGSLHSVIGILAAVHHRSRTGEGQYIDISMTDAMFALNAMYGADYLAAGEEPSSGSGWLNGGTFYDYYQTADNRYLSIGGIEPQFFERICIALGGEELLALGMNKNTDKKNKFKQQLEKIICQQPLSYWLEIFDGLDACVEPVLTLSEACNHEQIQAREMVVNVPASNGSMQKQIGSPIKMSACDVSYQFSGKKIGADNKSILNEWCRDDEFKQKLIESKAMG